MHHAQFSKVRERLILHFNDLFFQEEGPHIVIYNPAVWKPDVEEKQSDEERKNYRDSRVSTLVRKRLNMPAGSSSISNANARTGTSL